MKRSTLIYILSALILCACGLTSTSIVTPAAPAQVSLAKTYTNPQYGYVIDYPDSYTVNTVRDEYVEIGEKIVVEVEQTIPATDGPVLVTESTADLLVSGFSSTLTTGHIDSIGGYIPQQFRRVVIHPIGPNIVITLYALGLHATDGDISQIAPLSPEDIALFDKIVTSFRFQ